jgi:hypothetical protein
MTTINYENYDFPELMMKYHEKILNTFDPDELAHLLLCSLLGEFPQDDIDSKVDALEREMQDDFSYNDQYCDDEEEENSEEPEENEDDIEDEYVELDDDMM